MIYFTTDMSDSLLLADCDYTEDHLNIIDSFYNDVNMGDMDMNSSFLYKMNIIPLYNNSKIEDYDSFFDFWMPGFLLTLIGLIGIAGNILNAILFIVLQSSPLTIILLFLSISDLILILSSILLVGLPAIHTFTVISDNPTILSNYIINIFPYLGPVMYPLAMICQTLSIYLTTSIAIHHWFCLKSAKSSKIKSLITVLAISLFSVLYNIPRFFEVTYSTNYFSSIMTNTTDLIPTSLSQNNLYMIFYTIWAYLFIIHIIPSTIITISSILIINQLARERTNINRTEKHLGVMALIISTILLICDSPSIISNILKYHGKVYHYVLQFSNLLITINSSVKFLVYICLLYTSPSPRDS